MRLNARLTGTQRIVGYLTCKLMAYFPFKCIPREYQERGREKERARADGSTGRASQYCLRKKNNCKELLRLDKSHEWCVVVEMGKKQSLKQG